ncbi:hypothetical protein KR51_00009990 [Rubidibacter lacunae KORDI 51-2]|uniref:Uncharacterized protein n=1 Tax=Rubidibacter lacunae KORDI 51-2 TaxID=582515 RepID=U5DCS2_9CHRO|nr:hypothetical protein [Rubidibacter lacunae]ERN42328.1 hypothetical protein KR51_00009990 [Rubidibacter lacunae KORDI 51-2]
MFLVRPAQIFIQLVVQVCDRATTFVSRIQGTGDRDNPLFGYIHSLILGFLQIQNRDRARSDVGERFGARYFMLRGGEFYLEGDRGVDRSYTSLADVCKIFGGPLSSIAPIYKSYKQF